MAKSPGKIYQLKVNLQGAKPPIWRRLLIVNSVPLPLFHNVLQIVMGWMDSHLHQFMAGGNYYAQPDPYDDFSESLDENRYKLSQLLKKEKDWLIYEYDFGDSWQHKITLEKILPFDPEAILPQCIKGKGACPPEDVGGIWGFAEFLQAMADPTHPEHADYKDWFDGEFDPQAFDIDEINQRLSYKPRPQ